MSKDSSQWVELLKPYDYKLAFAEQSTVIRYDSLYISSGNPFVSVTNGERLLNALPIPVGQQITYKGRPVFKTSTSGFNKSATVTTPRGIWWLNTIKILVELWDANLYTATAANTYTTTGTMGAATEGPGGATEGVDSSGARYGFASAVSRSVSISATGVHTIISDSDFPASIIPMPVFLDGYIFIAKQSTCSIYNSDVGDQTTWTATGFINTEESGGFIVGLAKHHKSVVALCEDHIEFFRDAGIPAPNSPLQRESEHLSNIGCINRATITQSGDTIYFLGKEASGLVGAYKIEDYKVIKISTPSIDSIIRRHGGSNRVFGNITSWTTSTSAECWPTGYMVVMHGRWYYLLNFNFGQRTRVVSSIATYPAFLYDPELKLWIEIAASCYDSAQTSTVSLGWPYPHGTTLFSADATWESTSFAFQGCTGGSGAGEEIDSFNIALATEGVYDYVGKSGMSGLVSTETPMLIQTQVEDFGMPGLKSISGLNMSFSFGGVESVSAVGALTASLIRSGAFTSATSSTWVGTAANPGARYNLETIFSGFTPSLTTGNVFLTRSSLGHFYANWFGVLLVLAGGQELLSAKLRITPYEEQ